MEYTQEDSYVTIYDNRRNMHFFSSDLVFSAMQHLKYKHTKCLAEAFLYKSAFLNNYRHDHPYYSSDTMD
jgi:hypothetical protein